MEPRAGSVGFDGPPREEWDRAHATDDATGPITLHLLFSKTTRVAAPGATSLILALSSHGQQVSTRGALGSVDVGRLYFEWRSVAVREERPVDATKEADIFGGQIRR